MVDGMTNPSIPVDAVVDLVMAVTRHSAMLGDMADLLDKLERRVAAIEKARADDLCTGLMAINPDFHDRHCPACAS
jgi:hypothetical protein